MLTGSDKGRNEPVTLAQQMGVTRVSETRPISDAELLGYVDELLPIDQAADVEEALRSSPELRLRAAHLLRERDEGTHTVADIWRRHRVSCPSRLELGAFLLGTLGESEKQAVSLHLDAFGCRYCRADLDDLLTARTDQSAGERRRRFFESSVGRFRDGQ